jgi:hypothetical protein
MGGNSSHAVGGMPRTGRGPTVWKPIDISSIRTSPTASDVRRKPPWSVESHRTLEFCGRSVAQRGSGYEVSTHALESCLTQTS